MIKIQTKIKLYFLNNLLLQVNAFINNINKDNKTDDIIREKKIILPYLQRS